MKKIIYIIFPFVLLVISQLCVADIFITYLSGECEIDLYGTGRWQGGAIDMELKNESIIRTGPDAVMEIEIEGSIISFGANSFIRITDVSLKLGERKKIGWLKDISKYAKSMGRGKEAYAETSLAGIRGEKKDVEDIEWFEEFEEEDKNSDFQKAQLLFHEGKYTRAIPIFELLIAADEPGLSHNEIAYYLGISLFHSLRYQEALSYLDMSLSDRDAYFYEPALLHYGIAHYLLKNYGEAIEAYTRYTGEFPRGSLLPFALYMLGKCYKETGDIERARSCFLQIRDQYVTSEVYRDALREIESL
jgi:tetratricopeptide (TPR) repeat protein